MEFPVEASVMTLPSITLFPQALLPLYIFEPRYRRMLTNALSGDRMFVVAMQKPDRVRESPSAIAGLGLIRVCVDNPDGTSHLILQGVSRVELGKVVRYKPFRVQKISAIQTPSQTSVAIDALVSTLRDLVSSRIEKKLQKARRPKKNVPNELSAQEVIAYLDKLQSPDQMADLICCALLPNAAERQTILETVELELRLKHLIDFLVADGQAGRKNRRNE